MKTLRLSKLYLVSKRNLNYCLRLFSELERYYYDPVFDDIRNAAYVSIPYSARYIDGFYSYLCFDRVYARDILSAGRILIIYKKLFCRIPDSFFRYVEIDHSTVHGVSALAPSSIHDLSERLLNNDHDASVIFKSLHQAKLNILTLLGRYPNGI